MVAGEMIPGRDHPRPAAAPVVLHATDQTRITRLVLPSGRVIRKEPLGPDAQRRARHEIEILERLTGVEGVVQLATGAARYAGSILLVDVGGTALSGWETPLKPVELIDLARSLAHAVGGMHRRGVVH
ncbi:hypothetical protein, partial [Frankia sp. EI5c]|uniref:hypothetical protein n=1 Tax=Frankia sp. EI5c TaxID=683316 RepID=UPI0037BF2C8A